ncbi:MAG: aldose 1-epimerase [Clostridium sp.]|nr:aldose 1-epimerase [Clostridium sp.]MCM1547962.1 aldose 1-epimerase [Ruminococcus sp.]
MNYAKLTEFNGTPAVEISAGGYTAMIAYEIGSNVIRLHDDKNGIEFFRFKKDNSAETIKQSPEVWGLPTLYLPNRFADGVLKTSDAVYNLPVNEKAPYNNHIHGFLHKRAHTLVEHHADDNSAVVKTKYVYDENDEFFKYMPLKFTAEFKFTLSGSGLKYRLRITNLSDKMLPISLATHTAINSPFVDGGEEENIRLTVPVIKRCELNERCLPTEKLLDLTDADREYLTGDKKPVLQVVDNEMYTTDYINLNGQQFHGVVAEDTKSGKKLCYEVSDEYKFWIIWNDRGFNGYFCPEPMTAMIDAPNLSLDPDITGYHEIEPNANFEVSQRFFTAL